MSILFLVNRSVITQRSRPMGLKDLQLSLPPLCFMFCFFPYSAKVLLFVPCSVKGAVGKSKSLFECNLLEMRQPSVSCLWVYCWGRTWDLGICGGVCRLCP